MAQAYLHADLLPQARRLMSLLQQVRDILGARRAIEGTILRPAPGEERLEIDRDFAHRPTHRGELRDHRLRPALPGIEGIIELLAIHSELAQPLPPLAGVPGKPELGIGGNVEPLSPAAPFHTSSLRSRISSLNWKPSNVMNMRLIGQELFDRPLHWLGREAQIPR
jgi:hypothetical protein